MSEPTPILTRKRPNVNNGPPRDPPADALALVYALAIKKARERRAASCQASQPTAPGGRNPEDCTSPKDSTPGGER